LENGFTLYIYPDTHQKGFIMREDEVLAMDLEELTTLEEQLAIARQGAELMGLPLDPIDKTRLFWGMNKDTARDFLPDWAFALGDLWVKNRLRSITSWSDVVGLRVTLQGNDYYVLGFSNETNVALVLTFTPDPTLMIKALPRELDLSGLDLDARLTPELVERLDAFKQLNKSLVEEKQTHTYLPQVFDNKLYQGLYVRNKDRAIGNNFASF
jgi:hypothetical protein